MRFIRRFSNLTLSIALVASAFGVSLLLPLPAKAQATSAPQAPSQTPAQGRGIQAMPKAYPVRDNEGHGFRNEENQYEFYGAMEAFLGKHLKPQLPPRD